MKAKTDRPKILAIKEVQTSIGLLTVTEIEFIPRKFNAVEWADLTKDSQGVTK
jgi:hypothetical protein